MRSSKYSIKNSATFSVITFPQLMLETLQILLQKIIQLTQQVQSISALTVSSSGTISRDRQQSREKQPNKNNTFINLTQQKRKSDQISIGSLGSINGNKNNSQIYQNIKYQFEAILSRVVQYKNYSSFDKKMQQFSPQGHSSHINSFQQEQIELRFMKFEEQIKKDYNQFKNRLAILQEDIGQILIFYKELVFDR